MILFLFIILLLYIFSVYLFSRLRYYISFMTMVMGLILFLNDWNNTVVPDDTLKLSFILSFLLYGLMVWYHIAYVWEAK